MKTHAWWPVGSREVWTDTLRKLRLNGEDALLSAVANLPITFVGDEIHVQTPNPAIYNLIKKYPQYFSLDTKILPPKGGNLALTLEQKLEKIFGDKLVVE